MLTEVDVIYLVFAYLTLFFSFMFLLLFIKNKDKIHKPAKMDVLPTVTILIPAYNEEKNIEKTLRCVERLVYPKNKLDAIVIDDGSKDRTYEVAKNFARTHKNITVLTKKNQGRKSFAMNYGLKHAKSELVASMDADSMPTPNSLIRAVRFFSEPGVAAVTTSIFTTKPKNFLGLLQKIEYSMIVWTRKLLEFMEGIYVTPGPLSVYRKDALNHVGGFDEDNVTEDIEIAWRLLFHGYKIRMSTKSIVYTNTPLGVKDWWKQRLRWNIGGLQTTNKYKSGFLKRSYGPLGTFVIPFFTLSFFVSITGFAVLVWLFGSWVYKYASYSMTAYSAGVDPIKHMSLTYLPDMFTIFGIVIVFLSLLGVYIGMKTANKKIEGMRGFIGIIAYISIYITVFPIILIHSFIRMARRKTKW